MPQSASAFNAPSTPKSAQALSPFGKNSQNAATLLGKGAPPAPKKGKTAPAASSRSSPAPRASGSASPYTHRVASSSASAAAAESPLLGREAETTYHRKLRTLLQQYAAQAEAWEEVATYDGLKWAKLATDSWTDLHNARELGQRGDGPRARPARGAKVPLSGGHGFVSAHDAVVGPGGLRETRTAQALLDIEKADTGLADVVVRLQKLLGRITATSEAIEALLLEAAKTRGMEFAFQEPMWGTWSLERFVSHVKAITPCYVLSTAHLALLVPLLTRTQDTDAAPTAQATTPRRQAYEAWIALPHLRTSGPGSVSHLSSICRVEVARFTEP